MLNRRNIPSAIFLLSVLFIALSYWIGSAIIRPEIKLDQAILFHPEGDSDYLPAVSALSRLEFGEASLLEKAGTGVRSFPFASVVLHAVLVGFLGDPGFVVADLIFFLLYGWALSYFLQNVGVSRRLAEVFALLVLSGTLTATVSRASNSVVFWNSRFPRPLITEFFVVAFLILAVRLTAYEELRSRVFPWVLAGVVWACLLQSDIYQAVNLTLVAAGLVAYLLIKGSKAILRGMIIAAGTAAVLSIPFVYQRIYESPDVPRRWGMFLSGHRLIYLNNGRLIILALLTLFIELVFLYLMRRTIRDRRTRAAFLITGAVLFVSLLSGPLSLLLLGKGIQVYHFSGRTQLFIGYVVLLCAGWVIQEFARRIYDMFKARGYPALRLKGVALAAATIACLAAAAILAGRIIRNEHPTASIITWVIPDVSHYKTDFTELRGVLARPEYNRAQVLGAFDIQLANWWQYRNKYLYLPDTFNTTVTDREIETRVFVYLRLLDVTPEDFNNLLDHDYFLARGLSGTKYQAKALFTPWPIEDYSPDAQARIANTSITDWRLELPLSERRRLLEGYKNFDVTAQPARKPDIFVLSKDVTRRYLHPEEGNLRLAWANDTFEIWVPGDSISDHQ